MRGGQIRPPPRVPLPLVWMPTIIDAPPLNSEGGENENRRPSDIAQGLWGMSGWSGSDDQESLQAMQLAIEQGCNFFDTAWAYGEGKSDGLLGEILSGR